MKLAINRVKRRTPEIALFSLSEARDPSRYEQEMDGAQQASQRAKPAASLRSLFIAAGIQELSVP
jgi:hypothetical protein